MSDSTTATKTPFDHLDGIVIEYVTAAMGVAEDFLNKNAYTQKIDALRNAITGYNNQIRNVIQGYSHPQQYNNYVKNQVNNLLNRIDNCAKNIANYNAQANTKVPYTQFKPTAGGAVASLFAGKALLKAYSEAKQTGNYDLLGQKACEVTASLIGGLLGQSVGVPLVTALLAAMGITLSPLGAIVVAAAVIAATAYGLGELGGAAWRYILQPWADTARNWLSDKFDNWFGLNRSGNFHYYDPLVLDLDGDGIELVKANGWNGVQFDFNGDGIQSATGWVKADDGILVYDRNANGVIDDGSEIFGTDFYHLQNIIDGFSALSTLDSNKDNVINNQDIAFNQLKVWRDFNQDGTTQTGELFTLDELDIASLSLDTGNTQNNTNKNAMGKYSTYTKTNGKQYRLADVNFEIDSVHSEYKEHIAIGETQLKLPNLHGVGMLRDLREAAENNEFFAQYTCIQAA